jgi:DNA polymerase-3 subunit alpha
MECAEQAEASANQVSLFGDDDSNDLRPEYVKVAPWTDKQRLTEEKTALGFYLSGHPFDAYAPEAVKFARARLTTLEPAREPRLIAGVISAVRTQMTQRGKMVIVTLDDATATVDVTVYSELYEPNRHLFREDEFLAVQGRVSEDRFSGGLRITADKVMDIGTARAQYGRQFVLSLSSIAPRIDAAQLKTVLAAHRSESGLPMSLRYTRDGVRCEILLGDDWRVQPTDGLQGALAERLGREAVSVEY